MLCINHISVLQKPQNERSEVEKKSTSPPHSPQHAAEAAAGEATAAAAAAVDEYNEEEGTMAVARRRRHAGDARALGEGAAAAAPRASSRISRSPPGAYEIRRQPAMPVADTAASVVR